MISAINALCCKRPLACLLSAVTETLISASVSKTQGGRNKSRLLKQRCSRALNQRSVQIWMRYATDTTNSQIYTSSVEEKKFFGVGGLGCVSVHLFLRACRDKGFPACLCLWAETFFFFSPVLSSNISPFPPSNFASYTHAYL